MRAALVSVQFGVQEINNEHARKNYVLVLFFKYYEQRC